MSHKNLTAEEVELCEIIIDMFKAPDCLPAPEISKPVDIYHTQYLWEISIGNKNLNIRYVLKDSYISSLSPDLDFLCAGEVHIIFEPFNIRLGVETSKQYNSVLQAISRVVVAMLKQSQSNALNDLRKYRPLINGSKAKEEDNFAGRKITVA